MQFDFTDVTILIAEDEEFNQFYFREIFRPTNARLIIAENGQEAIDCMEVFPEINIALIDIKMPVLDGISAARIIRSNFRNLPLIAQTAYSMDYEMDKTLEAGFDAIISKPLNVCELFKLVRKHLD